MKVVRKKTKPGDRKPPVELAPLEPVCPVETAYLDALELRAKALPKGKEWLAFDPTTPGYEGLGVVKQLAWWQKDGKPFGFAVTAERARQQRSAVDRTWKRRQALMLALVKVPDQFLTPNEQTFRDRTFSRWRWDNHKRLPLWVHERATELVERCGGEA